MIKTNIKLIIFDLSDVCFNSEEPLYLKIFAERHKINLSILEKFYLELLIKAEEDKIDYHWDYIYEPGAEEVIESLLTRYIESQVYQGIVENIASEQAARMVAMKSATENAGQLIDELQLAYNKARQAAITKELAEIVAGAEAV